jgi:hypothetical protein
MHENEKIDYLAHTTKLLLDFSHMEERKKEYAKFGIDVLAELLKLEVKSRRLDIVHIQEAARFYNLDRVVAFPCTIQGENKFLFRMYGGSISAFCQHLNIPMFSENDVHLNPIYISQMENQYGIVLYERQKRGRETTDAE